MAGRIDKQIASEMGISLGTVRVYWKRIRMKVGGTRSEVIAELARNSLKLDFDGERTKADQLAKDLEECQVRERQLRIYEAAFEFLPNPLAILEGPVGRIVRANSAFANLHGYTVQELVGQPTTELTLLEEAAALEKQAAVAPKGDRVEAASTRRRKDGSTFASRLALTGGGDSAWVMALVA